MAIYKRNYAAYSGRLTGRWSRFLILSRYGFGRLFQSRTLVILLALSFCYPIGCLAFIYLAHNPALLALMNMGGGTLMQIDGRFFYHFCVIQGALAYLMTALVGPGLVSPDLVNGAMPLYFCRPLSRTQYILGKLGVLVFLLSLMTWVPGLVLFGVQSTLAGWGWFTENLWLAWALFSGLLVWVVVLSLIALAVSAWIRWKIAAGALVLGVFFGGAGFGAAVNSIMRTTHGALLDLSQVVHAVWSDLFRYDAEIDIPLQHAWLVLAAAALLSLLLLTRRVRPFEVVK